MKKTEKFCCVGWMLCSIVVSPLIGQPSHPGWVSSQDSLSFFPLAIGNIWTYGSYWFPDSKSDCSIFDTARINGRLYYLHTGVSLTFIGKVGLPIDTLRSDSLGRLWRYEGGREYMLFDFTHGDYPSHTTYPEVDVVRVLSNVDTTVPAGHFTGCVDLFFRRSFYDESIGYIFAPNVGIVQWYGPFLGRSGLLRAVVNGNLISSVTEPSAAVACEFMLEQNYPNPFNPKTIVSYSVPSSMGRDLVPTVGRDGQVPVLSHVRLVVYDLLGREVAVLVNERKTPGSYSVEFNAGDLASGVYFCRLMAGDFVKVTKMVLAR